VNDKEPTTRRPITLDDINDIDYVDRYKKIEVVNGDWNEADVPFYRSHGMLSGVIQGTLIYLFGKYAKEHDELGVALAGSVGFVMEGTRNSIQLMRRTDISYVRIEKLSATPKDEPIYAAPDIAIEVVYQDFADDMFQRIDDFLSHGTEQVWIVAPSPKTITVFLQNDIARIYRPGQVIVLDEILPDFRLDVATVFET
jgi:Uma2 family endonuclease